MPGNGLFIRGSITKLSPLRSDFKPFAEQTAPERVDPLSRYVARDLSRFGFSKLGKRSTFNAQRSTFKARPDAFSLER
jgi:hypothetical protein